MAVFTPNINIVVKLLGSLAAIFIFVFPGKLTNIIDFTVNNLYFLQSNLLYLCQKDGEFRRYRDGMETRDLRKNMNKKEGCVPVSKIAVYKRV